MRAFLVLIATLLLASPALGQDPSPHRGFWIGFGIGGGANLSEDAEGARAGGSGYIRLGGTVNPLLLVGGEVIGWARDEDGATVTQGNAAAVIQFYPNRGGFFLKAGLGFASWARSTSSGNATTTVTEGGFGATVGGGYDVRLGSNLFLTPNLDFLIQTVESDVFTENTGYLALFTVGLTWH